MKKQFTIIVIFSLKAMLLSSQVINNFNDHSYSLLKTLFFPSVNKETSILEIKNIQRRGLPPIPSFIIYNTSFNRFEYFNGKSWLPFNPYRVNMPVVSTTPASGITPTRAVSGGSVNSEDGATITSRGICWSLHSNPTTADSVTLDGAGAGNFSSYLNELRANTIYFARAYAKISERISYGNEIAFKTPPFQLQCRYGVDSVTLRMEDYPNHGGVEWQSSADTVNWSVIDGVKNHRYAFIPDKSQYYRAMTTSGPSAMVWVRPGGLQKYVAVPKNLTTGNVSLLQDFDSLDGWTITEGGGSLEPDAEHCLQGEHSIKISTAPGTSTAMQKAGPFDLSSYQVIRLWYYLPDLASVATVAIQLFQSNDSKSLYYQGTPYKRGWNSFEVSRAGFRNHSGANWDVPFDKLKITVKQKGTGIAWASIDRIEGITAVTQPAVLINFDDGYESVFTNAFPIMQARNIRATSYIVTSYVGQQEMVTWDDCRMLNDAGWDIGSHSHTHPNMTLLTAAEIDKELTTARDLLMAHDLTRAANFVAYPYGTNNELVQARMAANQMTLGRAVIDHYLTCPPNFNYTIEARNVDMTTTLEEVKSAIDDAIEEGHIITLLFHKIVEKPVVDTDWSVDDFRQLMDYMVQKQIQPLTITQYNALIKDETSVYKMKERD